MLDKHFWQWHQAPTRPSRPVGLCCKSDWGSGLHDEEERLSLKANQQEIYRNEDSRESRCKCQIENAKYIPPGFVTLWNVSSESAMVILGKLLDFFEPPLLDCKQRSSQP